MPANEVAPADTCVEKRAPDVRRRLTAGCTPIVAAELVPTFATHTHLRAIVAAVNADERKALELAAAESVKRVRCVDPQKVDWTTDSAQSLYAIRDTLEFKTTWHPIGA